MKQFWLFMCLLLIALPAVAAIIDVPADHSTIQAAINVASSTDTIQVAAGTYPEALTVATDSLLIVGADRSTVIIDASGFASNGAGIYVSSNAVTLQSLTLHATVTSSTPRYGVKFGSGTDCSLVDVTVHDIYRSGVDALDASNLTITNITSQNNGGHGLSLVDCNGVAVTDITLNGNGWQNVSVATWGRYSTLGTSGIVFAGTNSFGDLFQLEMGDYNNPGVPPVGAAVISYSTNIGDGADVTVQAVDFGFALHGEQDDSPQQVRIWFFSTLANASIIPGMGGGGHWTGNDMYIESLTDGTQLYVVPGCSIQAAIDASAAGDNIDIATGTYREQLTVDKGVTLAGAGIDLTVIEAPDPVDRSSYSVTSWTGSSSTVDPVIGVTEADGTVITDLTVDGRETGPNNFYGIYAFNSDITVDGCKIVGILYPSSPSSSAILNLVTSQGLGETYTADIIDCVMPNMQKGGIAIKGPGCTFAVSGNDVSSTPSGNLAGNGIQLSYGATGTTAGNIVTGVEYSGSDWAGTGILLFESGDVTMTGDSVSGCENAINYSDWGWVYSHVGQVDISIADADLDDNAWPIGAQLSRDGSDLNLTVSGSSITNSRGDGIDVFGTDIDPWGGGYWTGWDNGDLDVTISNCLIDGSIMDGVWLADYSGNTNTINSIAVSDCYFDNHIDNAVNNTIGGVLVDASGCWWGDVAGPTQVLPKAAGSRAMAPCVQPDEMGSLTGSARQRPGAAAGSRGVQNFTGSVDYSPWLASGADTSGDPGFQGDFSELWVDDDSEQSGTSGLIQEGIDLVSGSTVNIAAGTYVAQVYVTKDDLTIIGAGVGLTVIEAPAATMANFYMVGTNATYPVFGLDGSTGCEISGLTVDGNNNAGNNHRFAGFGLWNSGAWIHDVAVTGITHNPFNGAQGGNGFDAYNDTGGPYALKVNDCDIDDIQKTGMALRGDGLTVDLDDITILGQGVTTLIAQNGLQLSPGVTGTVDNMDISGFAYYTGTQWVSTAMLAYGPGPYTLTDVDVSDCEWGIYTMDYNGSINGGSIADPVETEIGVSVGLVVDWYASAKARGAGGPVTMAQGSPQPDVDYRPVSDRLDVNLDVVGVSFASTVTAFESQAVVSWSNGTNLLNVTGCDFSGWTHGAVLWDDDYSGTGDIVSTWHYNEIDVQSYGMYATGPNMQNATNNYWGDPTGPGGEGPGGGSAVSPYVDYDPWWTAPGVNIIFTPDPQTISLADDIGGAVYKDGVVCEYLGGGSGLLYGYSIDVTWDVGVITAIPGDFDKPDNGPFASAALFQVTAITGGVRIDAALGGVAPGIASGELFKATYTAVGTPDYAISALTFTLNNFRDSDNQPLSDFVADNGLMIVDLVGPSVTVVGIVNNTLTHTDDFVKNTDGVTVTATISDGGGMLISDIFADLIGFGGGAAVNPDSYSGGLATWALVGVTCTPADGTITVVVTADDGAGNSSNGSDSITADNTLPAVVADFASVPAHNEIDCTWTDAVGGDTNYYRTEIMQAAWGDYPNYGSLPTSTTAPAYPGVGTPKWFGTGGAITLTYDVNGLDRDIMYLQAYAVDMALNYSLADAGAQDRATNYWLGDVSNNDGYVNIADITILGATYGLVHGDVGPPPFNDLCDVGPTDNWSSTGIPLPDDLVDFEDLMIFSMNYGVVAPLPIFQQDATEQPQIAWRMIEEGIWVLELTEPCLDLKGINLRCEMSAGSVLDIQPGSLCAGQAGTVFLQNIDTGGLDAGLSLLGTEMIFIGSGELMRVTFADGVSPVGIEVLARSSDNQPLVPEMETTGAPDAMPTVYRMAQNFPNPFNPKTMINFDLPAVQDVKLAVFGPDGRKIVTLVNETMPAGFHSVAWNGRDASGVRVASGVYFYRIEAGPLRQTSKMLMLK